MPAGTAESRLGQPQVSAASGAEATGVGEERVAADTPGVSRWWYRSRLWSWRLRGPVPKRLLIQLPWSWPTNRIAAEAMLDGSFLHGGRRYAMRRRPWAAVADEPAAAAALHGFGWLVDLRAHGARTGQLLARALVDDWIDANPEWSLPAWRADVLAERLLFWLAAADFLLADADDEFPSRFLAAAARQARHLDRIRTERRPVLAAITIAKARLFAAVTLGVGDVAGALAGLAAAIDQQILVDGGHIRRTPASLLQVLRDGIDVRDALVATDQPVPPQLAAAIERMTPALRGFQLGDGRLAAFNGGGEGDPALIEAVLARAGVAGLPRTEYPDSGFQRLARGPVTVVVDTGAPPPPGADDRAHAGLFALTMSAGSHAVIVNAGALAGSGDGSWQTALRRSDAHSTLIVDGADVCTFRAGGGIEQRPEAIAVERQEAQGAVWLDLAHDGWRRRFGLLHRRRLYLSASGVDVRGEDVLQRTGRPSSSGRTPPRVPYAIRFHLHPDVKASLLPDRRSVLIRTQTGAGWRFQADGAEGAAVALADGVHVGDGDRPRRSSQIVVTGEVKGVETTVRWAFRQEGAL